MAKAGTRAGSAGRTATRGEDPALAAMEALSQPVDLEHVAVVDAIEEGSELPGHEVTVGDVAERLGIDPSRASRVVTAAIKAGYVRRLASQDDGRRICLELTPDGQR